MSDRDHLDGNRDREIFTFSGRDYITHYQASKGLLLAAVLMFAALIGGVVLFLSVRAALAFAGILILTSVLGVYPFLGLFVQIWLYFRPFPIWEGPEFLRPIFLVTIITLVFFLVRFTVLQRRKFRFPWEAKLFLILLGCMILSSFFAVRSVDISFSQNVVFLKILVFYLLIINLVNSKRELNAIIWFIIFCCAVDSIQGIKLYRYYGMTRLDGIGGVHRGANFLPAMLLLAMPVVFQKIGSSNMVERIASILLLPIFMVTILLTGSRGGMVSLVLVLAIMIWRSRKKGINLLVLTVVLLMAVMVAPGSFWERAKTIVDYEGDRSAESRLELWEAGLLMYRDHPLTGVGQGNFVWISPQYTSNYSKIWTGEGYVAHNIFIQLLAEGGLQTLLIFLAFLTVTFRGLYWAQKKLRPYPEEKDLLMISQGVQTGLIGFLVCGLFLSSAHLDIFYWFMALGSVIPALVVENIERRRAAAIAEAPSDGLIAPSPTRQVQ